VTATGVARQHGLSQSLIFWWRRQSRLGRLGGKPGRLGFVPVALPAELPASCEALRGVIEIDLGDGRRVRVDRAVDAGALRVVLSALERR
jgi:transposase